jgi:hypothetical protein
MVDFAYSLSIGIISGLPGVDGMGSKTMEITNVLFSFFGISETSTIFSLIIYTSIDFVYVAFSFLKPFLQ